MVFAVFFPAATGIMAGANMSGELKNPKRSIPIGTLWAIGVSFVIYMLLAFWLARSATEAELVSNYYIMVDKAWFGPLIIAGLLGATFSSALASIVGSSRILFAMGEHRVLPNSSYLCGKSANGQPRNAMLITGVLIFLTLLLRNLNAVAPLVTLFFLITYNVNNRDFWPIFDDTRNYRARFYWMDIDQAMAAPAPDTLDIWADILGTNVAGPGSVAIAPCLRCYGQRLYLENISSTTLIEIYGTDGRLYISRRIDTDCAVSLERLPVSILLVRLSNRKGTTVSKVYNSY